MTTAPPFQIENIHEWGEWHINVCEMKYSAVGLVLYQLMSAMFIFQINY